MSGSLSLHARRRPVTSPFGLLGTDENALSYALGYTFQQCPPLLQWFLKKIDIPGVHHSALQKAHIYLQKHHGGDAGQGITDIEIHLPGHFHVIVEAKVGLAVPTIEQCRKYLPRFEDKKEPVQKLVAIVQSPNQSFVTDYGKQDEHLSSRLIGFNWPQLLPKCVQLMLSKSVRPSTQEWVRSFYSFLDQEFRMKAFTTEVWILPVNTKFLFKGVSYWDIHRKYSLYFDATHPAVRPLYLAFRVDGQVDAIYRVSRIEPSIQITKVVPELNDLMADWLKRPHTIWHYGPPVRLAHPLRPGGGMYNRRIRCDLDLLLTCNTVKEIEKEMGNRRNQPEAIDED